MPAAEIFPSLSMLVVLLTFNVGCRTASQPDPYFAALLPSITYDTSVPPIPVSVGSSEPQVPTPNPTDVHPVNKNKTVCKTIGNGLKVTGALVLYGTITIVGWMLGADDDPYDPSPRGRADRELKAWTEARNRWLQEDR